MMGNKAYFVLADGSVYEGSSFGALQDATGEAVFNTSMTGYQEMLTDPSYAGQILIATYPLTGNYGISPANDESGRVQVNGFVVREVCEQPSHYLSHQTLHDYLAGRGIPGIYGVDTRAITRHLRSAGVMMSAITTGEPSTALKKLKKMPAYGEIDYIHAVTARAPYQWNEAAGEKSCHVIVLDCGLKYNILRLLDRYGCRVTVVPCTMPAEDIFRLNPDGFLLSPGPGDPDLPRISDIVETVRKLVTRKPVMGICFGSQLINRAFGGRHFKLKFGHRGGNHPVRELATGKVHITAQNHGYALDADTVPEELEITHINLNDGTVEGLRHRELPVFSIQYHAEASPGPLDNAYLFEQFVASMKKAKPAGT